jgi:uncharacterized protein
MTFTGQRNVLPAADYRGGIARFAEFAMKSTQASFWQDLLSEACDTELSDDCAVCGPGPIALRDYVTLKKWLRGAPSKIAIEREVDGLIVRTQDAAEELWQFVETLDTTQRSAFDIILRRALHPFEALATFSPKQLFNERECEWLHANQGSNAEVSVTPRWVAGEDIDYSGYLCVIIKVTRQCNLRCVYCHDWRDAPQNSMSFPVAAHLFRGSLSSPRHSVVDFIWHGGEPTLIGRRKLLQFLFIQRWFARTGQVIRNRIQTNATSIDSRWVQFLRRYRFQVGVSLDGPPDVNDATRPQANGQPTFDQVRHGMRLLREAKILGGISVVVTTRLLQLGAESLIRFLVDENVRQVAVLPVRPGNDPQQNSPYIDVDTFIEFLLNMDAVRRNLPVRSIAIREIDAALRALEDRPAGHCELHGSCVGRFFSVEHDGAVWHCDKYIGDNDYLLGNILSIDFDGLARDAQTRDLISDNYQRLQKFTDCPFFRYCRGWCPHERYLGDRINPGVRDTCCGLSPLFRELQTRLSQNSFPS